MELMEPNEKSMTKRTIKDIQLDLINLEPSPDNTRGLFNLVNDAIDSIPPIPDYKATIHDLREHHFIIAQTLMINYNEMQFEDLRQSVLNKIYRMG
jgi:hypothetical protein